MDIDGEITVAALTRAIQVVLQLDVSVSLSLSTFDRELDVGNLSLAEAGIEDGMTVVADEVVTVPQVAAADEADEAAGIEDGMTVVAEADEADEADEVVTVPQVAAAEADEADEAGGWTAEADGQRRRMRKMAERLWNKIEELEERVAVAEGVAAGATRAAVEAKVLAEAAAAEAAAAVAADGWRARSREELGRRVVAEAEVAVWRNWRQVVDLDTEAARWRGWRP